jgi:hypothetical protein
LTLCIHGLRAVRMQGDQNVRSSQSFTAVGAWFWTRLASDRSGHRTSEQQPFPSQSVTDSGHGRKMRQTTGRQRLPGGVPTPGPAGFKLPQPQTGPERDSSFCQARRPGPGISTAAGQPGRTATSVQTSATGFGSDRSQGLPSDENLQGQESTARLTQV